MTGDGATPLIDLLMIENDALLILLGEQQLSSRRPQLILELLLPVVLDEDFILQKSHFFDRVQ